VRKSKAALVSAGFFVVAPGTVVGVIPWLITRWEFRAEYEQYRRAVPAWLPRLRPWTPNQ
jgi:protein-S-isoprenylcysteine O-methyltransferase Ste14